MYGRGDHSQVCQWIFKKAVKESAVYVQRAQRQSQSVSVDATRELLALEGDQGGRQIMQEHPEDIWMMEVDERIKGYRPSGGS